MTEVSVNRLRSVVEARYEDATREREQANFEARAWAESVKKYDLKAAAERRREWIRFHRGLERVHSRLAEEHAQKAAALLGEGAHG